MVGFLGERTQLLSRPPLPQGQEEEATTTRGGERAGVQGGGLARAETCSSLGRRRLCDLLGLVPGRRALLLRFTDFVNVLSPHGFAMLTGAGLESLCEGWRRPLSPRKSAGRTGWWAPSRLPWDPNMSDR